MGVRDLRNLRLVEYQCLDLEALGELIVHLPPSRPVAEDATIPPIVVRVAYRLQHPKAGFQFIHPINKKNQAGGRGGGGGGSSSSSSSLLSSSSSSSSSTTTTTRAVSLSASSSQGFVCSSLGQPSLWFPCLDSYLDRCTFTIEVTVPPSLQVGR